MYTVKFFFNVSFQTLDVLKTHNDKTRREISAEGKSTKINDILNLYVTINYTEDDDKKKIDEDIVFNFQSFIESLSYTEVIVEFDVIENFDNKTEKTVFTKEKLSKENFVSFCTGSRYITHNSIRAGIIDF